MKKDKQIMIQEILKDDLNNLNDMGNDIHGWIEDLLLSGFKGYNNLTYKKIEQEFNQRFSI